MNTVPEYMNILKSLFELGYKETLVKDFIASFGQELVSQAGSISATAIMTLGYGKIKNIDVFNFNNCSSEKLRLLSRGAADSITMDELLEELLKEKL